MPEPETDTTTWQCNACVRLNYGANEQTKLIISYRRKQRAQEWQSLYKQLKFNYKRVAHFRRSLASDDMHLLERYLGQLAESLARYQQNIAIMETRWQQLDEENRQMDVVWTSIADKPEIEHELLLPSMEVSAGIWLGC